MVCFTWSICLVYLRMNYLAVSLSISLLLWVKIKVFVTIILANQCEGRFNISLMDCKHWLYLSNYLIFKREFSMICAQVNWQTLHYGRSMWTEDLFVKESAGMLNFYWFWEPDNSIISVKTKLKDSFEKLKFVKVIAVIVRFGDVEMACKFFAGTRWHFCTILKLSSISV